MQDSEALNYLLEIFYHQNTEMLQEKVRMLKGSDGEGWAIGELVERAIAIIQSRKLFEETPENPPG